MKEALHLVINMAIILDYDVITLGLIRPVLAATSAEINFKNVNERLQVHLSLTNDPTEMT